MLIILVVVFFFFLEIMKLFSRILRLLMAGLGGTIIYVISTRERINGVNNGWPFQRRRKKIPIYKVLSSET